MIKTLEGRHEIARAIALGAERDQMKLTVYLKSGNKIVLPFVKDYKIQNRGDEIITLEIVRRNFWPGRRLLVQTISLSQIEAITRT